MPKHPATRPPLEAAEEHPVRTLARSHHAPGDWIFPAHLVARSCDGLRTCQIAEDLECRPQTMRDRLRAGNDRGLDGVGIRPGPGEAAPAWQGHR